MVTNAKSFEKMLARMVQAMFCQPLDGMSAHSSRDINKGLVSPHFPLKFLCMEFLNQSDLL